jgi:hypothetical protein
MYFSRIRVNLNIRDLSHLHHVLRGNSYSAHQLLGTFPWRKGAHLYFREEMLESRFPITRSGEVSRSTTLFLKVNRQRASSL